MSKRAISVSLESDNLAWLRGRVIAAGRRSVSDLLDGLIQEARGGGKGGRALVRSVVGTIAVDRRDPELKAADRELRSLFGRSLQRRRAPGAARPAPSRVRGKDRRDARG